MDDYLIAHSQDELKNLGSLVESLKSTFLLNVLEYTRKKVDYNFQETFTDFYQKKEKDGKEQSSLRVMKSRTNFKLKNYALFIDRNFLLKKINTVSEEFINKGFEAILTDINIDKMYIFDTYVNDDKGQVVFSNIQKVLEQSSKDIDIKILSNIHNEETKNFYHKLSENYTNIEIKYMRESLITNSSLVYFLLENSIQNTQYLFYKESITEFVEIAKVDVLSPSSYNFYKVLTKRYKYYFNDEKLSHNSTIINVNTELLEVYSQDILDMKTLKLIEKIKEYLNSNIKNQEQINSRAKDLIGDLKTLKITFPTMKYSEMLIYSQIKTCQLLLSLQADDKLPKSRDVLKHIVQSGLSELTHNKTINQIRGNKFRFKQHNIDRCVTLKDLRNNLVNKPIDGDRAFSDIYPQYNYNTSAQIKQSLNDILNQKEYYIIVELSLKKEVTTDFFKQSSLYQKLAFRAIAQLYLGIKFIVPLHLTEVQEKNIAKLTGSFHNPEICKIMQGYSLNKKGF